MRIASRPSFFARSSLAMSRLALGISAITFVSVTAVAWGRFGGIRVDCGASVYQAAALAEGALLYRDLSCPYGPVGPYALAAAFRLFGIHLAVAYTTGLGLLVAESCLVWWVGRRFLSQAESLVALLGFWVLLALQPEIFNWALPNVFASPVGTFFATATLACLLADGERPRRGLLVLASLSVALATLSKIEHGVAAGMTVLCHVLVLRPRLATHAARLRNLVLALLPGGLLVAGVAALFLSVVPWDVLVFDNLYRQRSFGPATHKLQELMFPSLVAIYVPPLFHYLLELPARVAILEWLRRRLPAWRTWGRVAGGLGALLVLLAPLAPGYPLNLDLVRNGREQYQFAWTPMVWAALGLWRLSAVRQGYDPLALVATFSVAECLRWGLRAAWPPFYAVFAPHLAILIVREVSRRLVAPASPWPLLLVMGAWVASSGAIHAREYARKTVWLDYPRGSIASYPRDATAMRTVIDFLRRQTRPGEYVAVLPEEQFINFFAETRQPTRDLGIGPYWLATEDDVTRFLDELEAKSPRYVVVSDRRYEEFQAGTVQENYPRIAAYLAERYRPFFRADMFHVLQRAKPATPSP